MKILIRTILALLLALIAAAAEYYKLPGVRRVDSDLYRSGNLYVQTRYCYHYTYGEEALLKVDGMLSTIVWEDNTTCNVVKVFSK